MLGLASLVVLVGATASVIIAWRRRLPAAAIIALLLWGALLLVATTIHVNDVPEGRGAPAPIVPR